MGANAQTSVPAFTSGQVLTAQQQTEINTGIPVFATTTTRDAAFGGTGEKVLAEGQFAYIEATNATQYYDGAAWQTVGGGLTLITAQTIGSAVSSVTVSNAFSSTYDNYYITIAGGTGSTGDNLNLRLGGTTTNYYWAMTYGNYAGGSSQTSAQNGSSFGFVADMNTNGIYGSATLLGPNLAKNTTYYAPFARMTTGGIAGLSAGYLNDTTQYTAFTVFPNVGTMTGGIIRVYGYQNS